MGDATADKPTDARARLLAHFSGDTAAHSDRWSELWDKGDFLPWDRGTPILPWRMSLRTGKISSGIVSSGMEKGENGARRC